LAWSLSGRASGEILGGLFVSDRGAAGAAAPAPSQWALLSREAFAPCHPLPISEKNTYESSFVQDNPDSSRSRVQARPSKSKRAQANPNKIAWICLVLFVRIGTYQWVTVIPNKNFFSPRPSPYRQARLSMRSAALPAINPLPPFISARRRRDVPAPAVRTKREQQARPFVKKMSICPQWADQSLTDRTRTQFGSPSRR